MTTDPKNDLSLEELLEQQNRDLLEIKLSDKKIALIAKEIENRKRQSLQKYHLCLGKALKRYIKGASKESRLVIAKHIQEHLKDKQRYENLGYPPFSKPKSEEKTKLKDPLADLNLSSMTIDELHAALEEIPKEKKRRKEKIKANKKLIASKRTSTIREYEIALGLALDRMLENDDSKRILYKGYLLGKFTNPEKAHLQEHKLWPFDTKTIPEKETQLATTEPNHTKGLAEMSAAHEPPERTSEKATPGRVATSLNRTLGDSSTS